MGTVTVDKNKTVTPWTSTSNKQIVVYLLTLIFANQNLGQNVLKSF